MDAKVTLSFDEQIILKGKQFAEQQGLSLSRLTEILLRRLTSSGGYTNLEDIPIADWMNVVAEGAAEYNRPGKRKDLKDEYFSSK
ncbi:MAG: hypothetical protein EBZ77_09320 [Chitinophagia bacterium]|nr:hypothetical protein [Chitinophagia bacterium]